MYYTPTLTWLSWKKINLRPLYKSYMAKLEKNKNFVFV